MAAKDLDSGIIKKKELDDITTCCICTEFFTDPKALPCIHTFCMKCIQETGLKTNKGPGDEMPCPLCRRMFKIPSEGFRGLPKNFFIERLIQMANVSDSSQALRALCDACLEDEKEETGKEISAAGKYCVDCKNKLCEECCSEHRKFKLTKNHKLIPINEHESDQNVMTDVVTSACELHEENIQNVYCDDCKTVVCAICFIDDHLNHKGSHVKKFVDGFRKQIESNYKAINECRSQAETKKANLLKVKEDIQERVGNLECDVETRKYEVKQLADEHATSILKTLCSIRHIKLKEIQLETDDIDTYLSSLETYNSYCQNIMAKGSGSDICRAFSDLSARAVELQQQCQHTTETENQSFNYCFRKSELQDFFEGNCDNLIGEIKENGKDEPGPLLEKMTDIVNPEKEKEESGRLSENLTACKVIDILIPSSANTDCFVKLVKMKKVLSSELTDLLKDGSYSKIRHMVERPTIKETDLENFWSLALPYIIQRIKAWNGYVLSAQNIAAMVERTQKQKRNARPSDNTIQERTTYPISRLDCIAYIINAADSIVVQDILRIMSKFPMAIPLIIPDIEEEGKYIVVVPAMQNITVKWETTPGQIAENHLFSSPFRMICAVRLGKNKIGKSTMLNQLMRKQFMFSSSGEPGSRYGRPLTLDGTVEIVWLTQETCSDTTWKTTVCDHYKGKTEEVAILANLHGDALKYPDTLRYLEQLGCSFIVFRMPNSTDDEFHQLKKSISSQNLVPVLVDPKENLNEESEMETIYTDSLSSDDSQDTLRSLLRLSLNFRLSTNSTNPKPLYRLEKSKSLRYNESLQCKKSEEILDMVKEQGCFRIRQMLLNIDIHQHTSWNESLKWLVRFSLDIFSQQQSYAKISLTYLENQLYQLSANYSKYERPCVSEAHERLRRIIANAPKESTAEGDSEERQHQADLKKAQDELKSAMKRIDDINLGQEHFFRALGQMYEKSFGSEVTDLGEFNSIRDLPSHFADLLISGHAIEMLNGDSGEIQLVWIKAICEKVSKKLPNLKVFVISIIGLQSSGKSTLLNALFSCRFAVSVGRCSQGIFMRMVLMDEKLRKTYGCDAFILIDTEGLCSPEKMNDPKASQKDRLMATFAMGVSNLTIVNILGEGMTEMTEVLQIAIVAMARLRGGGIKPDILMVQHSLEKNLAKIDQGNGQFCEAMCKAFQFISKNDVEIGSASEECLVELTARIQSGDIFMHFGAFRDGSSVNSPPSETYHDDVISLFETLLNRTRAVENKSTYERWSNHFESYWACLHGVNFPLNFRNVKHIEDFLYFEKKVAKVKELNDSAMRHHREFFANKIREQINLMIEEKRQKVKPYAMPQGMLDEMERKLRKDMLAEMERKLMAIPHDCPDTCGMCQEFKRNYSFLLQEIESTEWGEETRHSLKKYDEKLHEITMKVLIQTFDGSFVKQGNFSEFSHLITRELHKVMHEYIQPTLSSYSPNRREIVGNIWRLLLGIAVSKESTPDLQTRINQALLQTYVSTGNFPNIIQDLSAEITVEDLSKSKAIKSKFFEYKIGRILSYYKLSKDQMTSLISNLEQLLMAVLKSRREDYLKTGLDFDEGMVSEIKTNFRTTMKEYEEKFNITLRDKFKISLQIYTLQQLRNRMNDLQALWNSQNKLSEILLQKKDDYISEIETTFDTLLANYERCRY